MTNPQREHLRIATALTLVTTLQGVSRTKAMRSTNKTVVRQTAGMVLIATARSIRQDNIKMHLEEVEHKDVGWACLMENTVQCLNSVNVGRVMC